jgi:hypothetical protein
LCRAKIGKATLLGVDAEVDGKVVDYHVKVSGDDAGHLHMTVGGVDFQGIRIPRAEVVNNKALDICAISAVPSQTSYPSWHITNPFALGRDNKRFFCSVASSTDHQVKYAEARVDRLGDDITEARSLAELAYAAKLSNAANTTTTFCIEWDGVTFLPQVLQDPDLTRHFPNGITTERTIACGDIQDPNGMWSSFSLHGYDCMLGITGRFDSLGKEESLDDYISSKLSKQLNISGAFELLVIFCIQYLSNIHALT